MLRVLQAALQPPGHWGRPRPCVVPEFTVERAGLQQMFRCLVDCYCYADHGKGKIPDPPLHFPESTPEIMDPEEMTQTLQDDAQCA